MAVSLLASGQVSRPTRSERVFEVPELRLPLAPEQRTARLERVLPSRRYAALAAEAAPRLVLPAISADSLPRESEIDAATGLPIKRTRIGVMRPVDLNMQDSGGQWSAVHPGVWRLEITSPDAVATKVHLSHVSLPSGVKLYISSPSGAAVQVYQGRGPQSDGEIFTSPVAGSTVTLEVEDTNADTRARMGDWFTIDGVGHLFQNPADRFTVFGTAAACELDWACYPDWAAQGESVARIEFEDTQYIYACSAVLLNNATNDGSPYLLTAHHCLTNATLAQTLTVYWEYKTNVCNGTVADVNTLPYSRYDRFLATDVNSDTTLVGITEPPPGATYAAWTTQDPPLASAVTGIHHPEGDYRRISFGTNVTDPSGSAYHGVQWSSGITEHGSSGSPLFTSDKKVIGTLTSGTSSCANPTGIDDYHRFSLAYPTFVDGQGHNYLSMGLPDDSFAPNQTRATAATLPVSTTSYTADSFPIVKPGIDDWFEAVLPAGQFINIDVEYFGTLTTSKIAGEFYLDSNTAPTMTFQQSGRLTFFAEDGQHTIYLHVIAVSGIRVPYSIAANQFVPQPPIVDPPTSVFSSWDTVGVSYYVDFNNTPTTYWIEWSTDPNLINPNKVNVNTIDPNVPPYTGRVQFGRFNITSLPPSTTVYFRVVAANDGGTTISSITSTATTALPLPTLNYPADGDAVLPDQGSHTDLSWSGQSPTFDLYLGTQSPPPLFESNIPANVIVQLAGGRTYYWQVISKFAYGPAASPIRSFNLQNTVTSSTSSVNFGNVQLGASSLPQTITFSVNPNELFFLVKANVSENFTLLSDGCTGLFQFASSCSVTVAYRALSLGTASGSVSLVVPNDFNSPHVVPLSATGYDFKITPVRPGRSTRTSSSVSAGGSVKQRNGGRASAVSGGVSTSTRGPR